MHPDTELRFIDDDIGFGVFATRPIPIGTLTYVQDPLDISITPDQYRELRDDLKKNVDRYSFVDADGIRVLCWDHAKYVNHCCHPNTLSTGYGFEIAVHDIAAGEQITDEYGLFNLAFAINVGCQRQNCRRIVTPDDIDLYYQVWDNQIRESITHFNSVPQPLLPHLDVRIKSGVLSCVAGHSDYVSVLEARNNNKEVYT